MKTLFLTLIATLALTMPALAQLKIVTTAPDYADLAKQIGGDKVDVHSVMKGPENVHNVMAKPTEMVFLNKADMFVHSGLDTEPWRDNLLKGARNPKVLPGKPGNVDMSNGITLKEVPTGKIDRSQGDVHAYGNPHFTGSPEAAEIMTVTLVKAMCENDPANAEFYKANAKKLVKDLVDVHQQLKKEFAPYAGLKVVTFHKAWEYFADAFDINVVTTIEPKPLITPSPAQMKQTIELMKEQGVKVVIVETYSSYDQAKYVADAAGAKLLVLPDHVNGRPEADTYQNLFRYDVHQIIDAAKAAGVEAKMPGAPATSAGSSADSQESH
jgi:zinc/manganese transport system substrate-binding protein